MERAHVAVTQSELPKYHGESRCMGEFAMKLHRAPAVDADGWGDAWSRIIDEQPETCADDRCPQGLCRARCRAYARATVKRVRWAREATAKIKTKAALEGL